MKILVALTICAAPVLSQDIIELPHQPMTFTNLEGRVYENVELEHANLDGVIYSSTNGSTVGMIRYKTLSTNFLASLKIPADRIQIAEQRAATQAEQKRQYDDAVRALAAKEQQEALTNLTAAAQTQAANQSSTSTNGVPAKPRHKKKNR